MRTSLYYILVLALLAGSCYSYGPGGDWDPTETPRPQLLSLPSIPANGKATVPVRLYFQDPIGLDSVTVVFTTTSGLFVENGKNTITIRSRPRIRNDSDSLEIRVTLQASTTADTHLVTAQIPGILQDNQTVTFRETSPTTIGLAASGFALISNYGNEVTLSATMKGGGNGALPSRGTPVIFAFTVPDWGGDTATFRSTDEASPYWRAVTSSNENGVATAVLGVDSLWGYRGPISVKASVGNLVSEKISLTVRNP